MATQPSIDSISAVERPRVKQNYLAILVAAIANFLMQAAWYTLFMQTWLKGIGHSMSWLESQGINPAIEYGTALVCAALMATAISCVTQLTGPQTALRGIRAGVLLWLGFVFTTMATGYIFEVRPISSFAVDAGFWLLGMSVMGAIVGGWKKK
jgi:hypothetical protein